ncbi:MAG: hypothetical protein KDC00_15115 [Flavobacteriales bacterium]|nr:hypothetical protein [Flavobacteriales bacterium]
MRALYRTHIAVLVLLVGHVHAQRDTLRFDHLVFFVSDSALEYALTHQLFQPAEKLATEHPGQGTEGHYVLFLNTSIEFLYLRDTIAAQANEERFGSPYTQRWKPGANPLAFGLIADPFDSTLSGFRTYHGPDQPIEECYLMAEGNTDPTQPLVYASMPHRAHKSLASLEEVERVDPAIREDLRYYLEHPSDIRTLTGLSLSVPDSTWATGNVALLHGLEGLDVHAGPTHTLTLEFDDGVQGREFRWDQGITLLVRY